MKGSYNFIGVDEKFIPWIFLVRSSREDLLDKIPEIIGKAKEIGKRAGVSEEQTEKIIVLFDREGYSAKLYRELEGSWNKKEKRKAIFISWAKYSDKWTEELAEEKFDKRMRVQYEIQKNEDIKYCEMSRMMNKYGMIRTIVIQSGKEKKRSAIYTNGTAEEITTEMIIQLMCRRWGEENCIKDILTNQYIDYSPGYNIEAMEEQPLVDNPIRKELIKQKSQLLNEVHKLKLQLADAVLNEVKVGVESRQKFQIQLKGDIAIVDNKIKHLEDEIRKMQEKVRFDEAHEGEQMVKLNYEKKRILDCIKIFSYNIEKKMQEILLKYHDNRKEVRSVLKMIVERGGYIKLENGILKVQLRKFKNTEINYVARHLCEELNKMNAMTLDKFQFPLFYEVL
jgi:hypothetical protein